MTASATNFLAPGYPLPEVEVPDLLGPYARDMVPGFSVIIPTLQRSPMLGEIVDQCAAHPMVAEVLVINNAPTQLTYSDPKVRVLNQSQNIYVNPAWNLGAELARGEWLAILNDDVSFHDEALSYAGKLLRRGRYGVVAPDNSCLFAPRERNGARPISHRVASSDNLIFGTFMCMRTEDYVVIPDDLKIWGGDHVLFLGQRRPNAVLVHTPFRTTMNTTSGSAEFDAFRERERVASARITAEMYGTRWWHRPARLIHHLRFGRARLKQLVNR